LRVGIRGEQSVIILYLSDTERFDKREYGAGPTGGGGGGQVKAAAGCLRIY
jgi:hypothetical protein